LETDFIIPISFVLDRVTDPEIGRKIIAELIPSTRFFKPSIGKYLSANEVRDIIYRSNYSIDSILNLLYGEIGTKLGREVVGDKSPNDLAFMGILRKTGLFGTDIKIIHIVRDVRDVVMSLTNTKWAPKGIEKIFPRVWETTNVNLARIASESLHPYCRVRYEDMVADPEGVFPKLCLFLGVEYSEKMLQTGNYGHELKHLEHHRNLDKGFLIDRCFAWKADMPTELAKDCTISAAEGLREFGYER
ncbi:MAG: sulfotransferase, partial [Methylococcaceae bacterium]|nr:sulfotransferase [Methylococcaceae bacterium]